MPADRRIQKTKKLLTEALIQLILEKEYENVTIQDIIDKANIGRSTFYLHYESKEQLLLDGYNNLNIPMLVDSINLESFFENVCKHISENRLLAQKMLVNKKNNVGAKLLKDILAVKIKKQYSALFDKSLTEQKLLKSLANASGATVLSMIISWLEDELPISYQSLAITCQNLVNAIFSTHNRQSS